MRTRSGALWAVPYPQELNDIPMIIARQMTAPAFADMILDQFDEMLIQSRAQPLVMGIALHPYIVGQPHRLKHLRRALQGLAQARDLVRSGSPPRGKSMNMWLGWSLTSNRRMLIRYLINAANTA